MREHRCKVAFQGYRAQRRISTLTQPVGRVQLGGPEGARTPDLIHAMDALFQLRYRPMFAKFSLKPGELIDGTHCTR
jgi:hypothetical protein